MGKLANVFQAVALAGVTVLGTSCATHNAGPPVAKAHKGYVDFYSPGNTNLYWSVKRLDPTTSEFKTLFYKLKPLPDGV
ncbi:MAG TPA: hypothetical protein VNZ22_06960, partial [Bacillota bacterium]|nr:hypothetical protein [Bacillota bacterium]